MSHLRSRLVTEEQHHVVEGPTRFRIGPNRHELTCGTCGEFFFVDDTTYEHASDAIESGFENPFCCEECEEEIEYLSHER
jgi:hypothetical protein